MFLRLQYENLARQMTLFFSFYQQFTVIMFLLSWIMSKTQFPLRPENVIQFYIYVASGVYMIVDISTKKTPNNTTMQTLDTHVCTCDS